MPGKRDNSSGITLPMPSEVGIARIVRFWVILPFYIPSLLCSLFVLYHVVFNRTLRRALHNHVIILLLIINSIYRLTSISWTLDTYRVGYVPLQTPSFCLAWQFINEISHVTTTMLFVWATIERHILIFHDRLVATQRKCFLFHYLPIVGLFLYTICYNVIVILFPSCVNILNYREVVCGNSPCFYDDVRTTILDLIINHLIPATIIIVCSITLLLRVIHQKHRMRRAIRWRNHRKMAIQLLSVTVVYFIMYVPEMVMHLAFLSGVSEGVGSNFDLYADFFNCYGNLLLPFVIAGFMPELGTKIRQIFPCCQRRMQAVQPATLSALRPRDVRKIHTTTAV